MQLPNCSPVFGYLAAVLRSGVRNYRYRRRIRSLAGFADEEFRLAASASPAVTDVIRYRVSRISAGLAAAKGRPAPAACAHRDGERSNASRRQGGTPKGVDISLPASQASCSGGPHSSQPCRASSGILGWQSEGESEAGAMTASALSAVSSISVPGTFPVPRKSIVMSSSAHKGGLITGKRTQACTEISLSAGDRSLPVMRNPSGEPVGEHADKDLVSQRDCRQLQGGLLQKRGEEAAPGRHKYQHGSANSGPMDVPMAEARENDRAALRKLRPSTRQGAETDGGAGAHRVVSENSAAGYSLATRMDVSMNPSEKRGQGRQAPDHGQSARTYGGARIPIAREGEGTGASQLSGASPPHIIEAAKFELSQDECRETVISANGRSLTSVEAGSSASKNLSRVISIAAEHSGSAGMAERSRNPRQEENERIGAEDVRTNSPAPITRLLAHSGAPAMTAIHQGGTAAFRAAEAHRARSPQCQADHIIEMRRATGRMVAGASRSSTYDQGETSEHRPKVQLLPAQVRLVPVVKRGGRSSMPSAFWERNYLGRCRLRCLR